MNDIEFIVSELVEVSSSWSAGCLILPAGPAMCCTPDPQEGSKIMCLVIKVYYKRS